MRIISTILVSLLLIACSSPQKTANRRRAVLEDDAKRYLRMIRWQEYDRAKPFIAQSARQEILGRYLKNRTQPQITDFGIISVDVNDEADKAEVHLWINSYLEKRMTVQRQMRTQEWIYADKYWQLTQDNKAEEQE